MARSQRMGGVAALVAAGTFVVGFALLFALLVPAGYFAAEADPVQNAAFLAEHHAILSLWYLTIYVVFGVVLVVLSLALHERLHGAPAIAQVATAFGLIWAGLVIASGMVANVALRAVVDLHATDPAQAASLWMAANAVVTGLGGGNEIVGGLWLLLVSSAAMRTGALPRALDVFGIAVSVAGILTTVPVLAALGLFGALFGLGLIVWFVWAGVVLLRGSPGGAVDRPGGPLA